MQYGSIINQYIEHTKIDLKYALEFFFFEGQTGVVDLLQQFAVKRTFRLKSLVLRRAHKGLKH